MKLAISRLDLLSDKSTAVLTHKGREIQWQIKVLDKTNYDFDIFLQINGYWASLKEEHQDKIFDVYVRIMEALVNIWTLEPLIAKLYDLVAELYSLHDLEQIRFWLDFHSGVGMPDGLREAFKESYETPGTRERTYTKEDYRWLVAMTVALRAMVPVWGEFIYRTEQEIGTQFKEYKAFQLLAYANINHSQPMEKLRGYVAAAIPSDKSKDAAIWQGGISSEDFPFWMLSLVVVRRLSVGDIQGTDPNYSLVKFIYQYIGHKTKSHDSSFSGVIKPKLVEGQGQEGENNLSKLEGYKIKQEIPAGDIAIIGHYAQDLTAMALKIMPDIDLQLLKASLETVRLLEMEQIRDPQITLMQWVLKPAIPPRGLMLLNKKTILGAMAVTQALLWHRKHYDLAALVSATAQTNADMMQLGGSTSRARLPKEMVEELNKYYPFSRPAPGKQKGGVIEKQPNPAVIAINNMNEAFSQHDWRLTVPAEWVPIVNQNKNTRSYYVPHEIKIRLGELALAIAKRSFK